MYYSHLFTKLFVLINPNIDYSIFITFECFRVINCCFLVVDKRISCLCPDFNAIRRILLIDNVIQ